MPQYKDDKWMQYFLQALPTARLVPGFAALSELGSAAPSVSYFAARSWFRSLSPIVVQVWTRRARAFGFAILIVYQAPPELAQLQWAALPAAAKAKLQMEG
jgi:hypothetical protein